MNILLCNDDGINSPALHTLCRAAAARHHHVTVCAPAQEQSCKSHSFTAHSPVPVTPVELEGADAAYAVAGTPADCARLGLMSLCTEKIDLVISGINIGWNMGLSTYVSGTVGAAREAAFQGVPAMAVSMETQTPKETERFFADWLVRLGERFAAYPRPAQSVCNVNVPGVPVSQLRKPMMCSLNRHMDQDGYERRISPRGQMYFWLTQETLDPQPEPDSDLYFLRRNHITCTMLTPTPCDQTAWRDLLTNM